jgi:hypothetical protein
MKIEYKGIKGNWEVIEINISDFKQICVASNESKSVLSHIYLPEYKITDELKATANLMANAYELLQSLQSAVILLKQTTEFEVLESWKIKTQELEKVLEKASK